MGSASGTASSLSFYIGSHGYSGTVAQAALYVDSGDDVVGDATLVAVSSSITLTKTSVGSGAWDTFPISATLNANLRYFFVYSASAMIDSF